MMIPGLSTHREAANVRFIHKTWCDYGSFIFEKGDGLRHFGYQKLGKFYNGVTLDDIHGVNATNVNGIGGESQSI
jgi:hypothetical protein